VLAGSVPRAHNALGERVRRATAIDPGTTPRVTALPLPGAATDGSVSSRLD